MAQVRVSYFWKKREIVLQKLSRQLKARGFLTGASVSNLSRIFSGRHNPSYALAKAIAEIRGISTFKEFDEMLGFCRRRSLKAKMEKG